MKKLIIFPLMLLATGLLAQRQEAIFGHNGFGLSGIWGSVTKNYTFYEGERVFHNGGNIGFEFGRTVFLGYAWNKTKQDIPVEGSVESYRLKQRNAVISIYPASYQALHPTLTFQGGPGRVELDDGTSDRVFVLQPSAGVELNVFSFFRLGIEGGYRFVTNPEIPLIGRKELSAPFAQVNLRFGISWGSWD